MTEIRHKFSEIATFAPQKRRFGYLRHLIFERHRHIHIFALKIP